MKIRIDKDGFLKILRKDNWKYQECRPGGAVLVNEIQIDYGSCCDRCPLFGEPTSDLYQRPNDTSVELVELKICKRTFLCEPKDFEDER